MAVMTKTEILEALKAGKLSVEDAAALLPATVTGKVTMKVSEKGCVTFRGVPGANVQYGLSLRKETIAWLYASKKEVEEFVRKNAAELEKRSEESRKAKAAS